jgi:uncharacterized membrane protein YoaT (DUF817 family)
MKHENRITCWLNARMPIPLAALTMFVLKQAWACLFGGCLLAALIVTKLIWQDHWSLARYDALVLIAVSLQIIFLWLRLESWTEARVIAVFHLTGTAMEIFKVSAGSWSYPEPALLKLFDVPLFSGFMYAAVGSYMVRVIKLFDMVFAPFPPLVLHFGLALAVYVNFFSHHFIWDVRVLLFLGTIVLYAQTRIWFRIGRAWYWMPLPLAAFLSSLFLWVAENIGTITGTWIYAGQSQLEMVSLDKVGSWYLLLYVAFATVTLVKRDALKRSPVAPAQTPPGLPSSTPQTR